MFDISWSEFLILAIVTLVFVGPKELPVLMRTLGRYAGVVRRHANEFKSQFDAAMREAELDGMRQEVEKMQASINKEVMSAKSAIAEAGSTTQNPAPARDEVEPHASEQGPADMSPMAAPRRLEP